MADEAEIGPHANGRSCMNGISKDLLDILACPLCKTPVRLEGTAPRDPSVVSQHLVCTKCGRRYPIRSGIPCMRVEDAEPPEGRRPAGGRSATRPEGPTAE